MIGNVFTITQKEEGKIEGWIERIYTNITEEFDYEPGGNVEQWELTSYNVDPD